MRQLKLKPLFLLSQRDGSVSHQFLPRQDRSLDIKVVDNTLWVMTHKEVRQLRNFLNRLLPIQSKKRSRPTRSTRASTKHRRRSR